jgi:hypothetical protein
VQRAGLYPMLVRTTRDPQGAQLGQMYECSLSRRDLGQPTLTRPLNLENPTNPGLHFWFAGIPIP